jgi:uncharacterized protein (DUF2164 family)
MGACRTTPDLHINPQARSNRRNQTLQNDFYAGVHFEDILLDPKLDSKVLTDNLSVDLDGKNYFYESNETPNMTIELSKEVRQQAISSIERYFQENMDEKIGNIAAGALLGFFIEEIGPVIYNMAVAEVQERIQTRVMEIDLEVNEDPFQFWRKYDQMKKR